MKRRGTVSTAAATGTGAALRPRTLRGRRRQERLTLLLFVGPAAVAMLLLFAYPVAKNVLMSVQDYSLRTFVTGEAPWVGMANYTEAAAHQLFTKAMVNTLLFTFGSIVGQFGIGLLLALFFNKRFPLSGVLRGLLLLPWLLPLIVTSATWRSMLDQDSGVLNRVLQATGAIADPVPWLTSPDVALVSVVLVNIWIGIPFNATLLYSGLQEIPADLYEAGALDGAIGWKAFWHITWPNLRAVVSVVLVLGVIYTLRVLDIILGLTGGGPSNATQTLATLSYERSFVDFDFGQGAALNNILIVISFACAVGYLRSIRHAVDEQP